MKNQFGMRLNDVDGPINTIDGRSLWRSYIPDTQETATEQSPLPGRSHEKLVVHIVPEGKIDFSGM